MCRAHLARSRVGRSHISFSVAMDAWPFQMSQRKFARLLKIRRDGRINMMLLATEHSDEFTESDVLEMMAKFGPMEEEFKGRGFAAFAVADNRMRDKDKAKHQDKHVLLAMWEAMPEAEQTEWCLSMVE